MRSDLTPFFQSFTIRDKEKSIKMQKKNEANMSYLDWTSLFSKAFITQQKYFALLWIKMTQLFQEKGKKANCFCSEINLCFSIWLSSAIFRTPMPRLPKNYKVCKSALSNFLSCAGSKWAIPGRQDGAILPCQLANQNKSFASYCLGMLPTM